MYSYEIEQLLKKKEFLLEVKEYMNILETSPQIYHHTYDKEKNLFQLKTDDRYDFKFKVKSMNNNFSR